MCTLGEKNYQSKFILKENTQTEFCKMLGTLIPQLKSRISSARVNGLTQVPTRREAYNQAHFVGIISPFSLLIINRVVQRTFKLRSNFCNCHFVFKPWWNRSSALCFCYFINMKSRFYISLYQEKCILRYSILLLSDRNTVLNNKMTSFIGFIAVLTQAFRWDWVRTQKSQFMSTSGSFL